MEKRKRGAPHHFVIPGVFSGHEFEHAVGQMQVVTRQETKEVIAGEALAFTRLQELEEKMEQLQQDMAQLQERYNRLEIETAKERSYLYQVVLALKKEWEETRK